ncbi:MAG TPA: hypothetical protein DDW76_24160 [Cyanobacteria bacterium UBA11369]|nr:hypothetical protein [Cyanobacteria bacterium UBA11371]HBE19279.1 hypothetical protein [Cyanobacteria bacterium UBA11367]HBE51783.1 hypothetical protein [Cyanobacteria bacterium UBA11369]
MVSQSSASDGTADASYANNADIRSLFLKYWQELERCPNCINLGMGMPPIELFKYELEAQEEFDAGRQIWQAEYQHQAGDKSVREAFSKFEAERTGIAYTAENIMLVSGALRGFSLVLDCLVKDGTRVVEIVPTYPLCSGQARNASERRGGKLLTVVPKDTKTFQITFEEIKPYIQPSTIIYLTNPNNPTGLYLPKDVLSKIVTTCENEGAYLIIDQACDLPLNPIYDDRTYLDSPSVIRILSLSKTYLLAGFRLGYVVANPQLIEIFSNAFAFSDGNAPCVANKAIIKYLNNSQLMPLFSKVSRHKVELALNRLTKCRSVIEFIKPEACFYIFLKISYPYSSWRLFKELVSRGVNVVPGCLFGVREGCWIRICCGREDDVLIKYLDKLSQALDSL